MSGWLTNGVPALTTFQGDETASFDTNNGASLPLTGAINVQTLAALVLFYGNTSSKTTVAGSRYYVSYTVGQPTLITGIAVLVGSTGGTDNWLVELHDSTGALVATSNTSGVTAGTAGTWQKFDFTTPYQAEIGEYFLTLQTNGTTAHPAVYNAPSAPVLFTGSATGTFGTGAAITPPTTYTAALGPVALPY